MYDQAFNKSFKEKPKSIQYNACLILTGAIRGMSKKKKKKKKLSATETGAPSRSLLV